MLTSTASRRWRMYRLQSALTVRFHRNRRIVGSLVHGPDARFMVSSRASTPSYGFRCDHEPTAERGERRLELFEANDVIAVEDMGDLLLGPAQPLRQLRLVKRGLAHCAVEFELGSGKSRERDR